MTRDEAADRLAGRSARRAPARIGPRALRLRLVRRGSGRACSGRRRSCPTGSPPARRRPRNDDGRPGLSGSVRRGPSAGCDGAGSQDVARGRGRHRRPRLGNRHGPRIGRAAGPEGPALEGADNREGEGSRRRRVAAAGGRRPDRDDALPGQPGVLVRVVLDGRPVVRVRDIRRCRNLGPPDRPAPPDHAGPAQHCPRPTLSPDGRPVAVLDGGTGVHLFDRASGKELRTVGDKETFNDWSVQPGRQAGGRDHPRGRPGRLRLRRPGRDGGLRDEDRQRPRPHLRV